MRIFTASRIFGPNCSVIVLNSSTIAGSCSMHRSMLRSSAGSADLPMQQRAMRTAMNSATAISTTPIAMEPAAS